LVARTELPSGGQRTAQANHGEPQNIEQGTPNVEGTAARMGRAFVIRQSLFDILRFAVFHTCGHVNTP
jgi:hypothetical protein